MSNRNDDINNKKIRELLDKNKNPDQAMDDFDKEALEGFSMLKNEKEILELKQKLDDKIYPEVFAEEKKAGKNYWLAAAGLLLVICFSVYFIQTNKISEEKDLAIHSEKSIPSLDSPGDQIQKTIEDRSDKNRSLEFKAVEKGSAVNEKEYIPAKKESAERNSRKSTDESDAEEEQSAKKETGAIASARQAAPVAPDPKIIPESKAFTNQAASEIVITKDAIDDVSEQDKIVKVDALQSKKPKNTESKKKQKEEAATPMGASRADDGHTGGVSVLYNGGDKKFIDDLKKILEPKNLSKKFEATLFINEEGNVENAKITNACELSDAQQKEVLEILKGCNGFRRNKGFNLVEYELVFTP